MGDCDFRSGVGWVGPAPVPPPSCRRRFFFRSINWPGLHRRTFASLSKRSSSMRLLCPVSRSEAAVVIPIQVNLVAGGPVVPYRPDEE